MEGKREAIAVTATVAAALVVGVVLESGEKDSFPNPGRRHKVKNELRVEVEPTQAKDKAVGEFRADLLKELLAWARWSREGNNPYVIDCIDQKSMGSDIPRFEFDGEVSLDVLQTQLVDFELGEKGWFVGVRELADGKTLWMAGKDDERMYLNMYGMEACPGGVGFKYDSAYRVDGPWNMELGRSVCLQTKEAALGAVSVFIPEYYLNELCEK